MLKTTAELKINKERFSDMETFRNFAPDALQRISEEDAEDTAKGNRNSNQIKE